MIVLSHFQITPLLSAKAGEVGVSLDLNLTKTRLPLDDAGLHLPIGILTREAMKKIVKDDNACFLVSGEGVLELTKIQAYSEELARFYSLFPTKSAPTMRVAGFPMHRIKDTDPWADTKTKITTLGRIKGNILDTTTGLGYTSILAAKTADHVTTIEIDPTATEICRYNPWSQGLFEAKIDQLYGDAFDVIDSFATGQFEAVVHDPPTRQLAGELYSEEFYGKVRHVLRRGGRFFHYIGDPESPFGRSTTEGVIKRVRAAGFAKVERRPEAFGIVAY